MPKFKKFWDVSSEEQGILITWVNQIVDEILHFLHGKCAISVLSNLSISILIIL